MPVLREGILLSKSNYIIGFLVCLLVCLPAHASYESRFEEVLEDGTIIRAPIPPKVKKYDRLKKTVAIINFSSASPSIGADVGKGITDMLATALTKSGKFIVIERDKLKKVLAEQVYGHKTLMQAGTSEIEELESENEMVVTGMLTAKSAIQIGKMLHADVIVTGRVINFEMAHADRKKDYFVVGLESHVISGKTGKTLVATEAQSRSASEIEIAKVKNIDFVSDVFIKSLIGDATRKAVEDIVYKVQQEVVSSPWEGKIIKEEKDKIYVTGGSRIGHSVDDELVILEETNRVEDSVTGALMDRDFEVMGNLKIESLQENFSICRLEQAEKYKKDVFWKKIKRYATFDKDKNVKKDYVVLLKNEYEEDKDIIPWSQISEKAVDVEQQWDKISKMHTDFVEKLYKKDKTRTDIRLSKGGVYLSPYIEISSEDQKRLQELLGEYYIIAKLCPDDHILYSGLAWVYTSLKAYDKAVRLLEKAISLDPQNLMYRQNLCMFYQALLRAYEPYQVGSMDAVEGKTMLNPLFNKDEDWATKECREIARGIMQKHGIDQEDLERWRWEFIREAELYLKIGKDEIPDEAKFFEMDKKAIIRFIVYISNIDLNKNYDKSIVILSDMSKIVEDSALIWNGLTSAYGVKALIEKDPDAFERAKECAEKAVEHEPDNAWYHNHLAIIYSLKAGYYTDGRGCCTVYLLNEEKDMGLGYEPKFLYADQQEREKYKQLAIKHMALTKEKRELGYKKQEEKMKSFWEDFKSKNPEKFKEMLKDSPHLEQYK